jgi:hypothetical protein
MSGADAEGQPSGPERIEEALSYLDHSDIGRPYAKVCRLALAMHAAAVETGDDGLQDIISEMLKILALFAHQSWFRKFVTQRFPN